METLAFGFGLLEGPRAAPDGSVYFSDVHRGGVRRLWPDGSIDVVVPKRRGVGGIALHADGGLVISGKNICHVRDGETRVLYARDDVGGFNDLFADAAGRVICASLRDDPFTVTGSDRRTGDCYRIDLDGAVTTLYEGIGLTNGIGFSPDGRRLYHADTAIRSVVVHDVDADGNVGNRAIFAKLTRGMPDGLTVDTDGGVWVASYGGGCVSRFRPDGSLDRHVDVPATNVTSLCFAGAGLDELIVVTEDNTDDASREGTVFRFGAEEIGGAVGVPAPLARV